MLEAGRNLKGVRCTPRAQILRCAQDDGVKTGANSGSMTPRGVRVQDDNVMAKGKGEAGRYRRGRCRGADSRLGLPKRISNPAMGPYTLMP
jgi:hypothetical protein